MPFDRHVLVAHDQQDAGQLGQQHARLGLERRLVDVEEDVGQVDDQASRRLLRVGDQGERGLQTAGELGFFRAELV